MAATSSCWRIGITACLMLGACTFTPPPSAGPYGYVRIKARTVAVADKAFHVTPTQPWNRFIVIMREASVIENWTRDGPLLNQITYIGGLREGLPLIRTEVPSPTGAFRADMKPEDLAPLLERFFRDRGQVQRYVVTAQSPASFLGGDGIQVEFEYTSEDEVPRRGSCVMAIINRRLYAMMLAGEASHYFGSVEQEYREMVASATRK